MNPGKPRNRMLTVGEVATRAGVSVDTVRGWDRAGVLPARRTPGGQRRYLETEVGEFMRRKMGVSSDSSDSSGPVAPGSRGSRVVARSARSSARGLPPEPCSPWQEDVQDARAEVVILKARREAETHRRAMADEAQQGVRRAEQERMQRETEQRLTDLKSYGRTLARSLPTEWQAQGVSDLEDRKSTRLNSSHIQKSRMPSSA